MRSFRLVLLLALLLPLTSVRANIGKNEGTVFGMVVDAITKKPIQGVVVTLSGPKLVSEKETSTDADGNFKLSQLPGGDLTITCEKKGYRIQRKDILNTKDGLVYRISMDMIPSTEVDVDNFSHPLLRMSGATGKR